MLLPSGNPFKCHEEVLYFQLLIPPKRFDIFSPDWGMLRRSRCIQILSLNNSTEGAYYLVHGDLSSQHSLGITLRFTGSVPADSRQ